MLDEQPSSATTQAQQPASAESGVSIEERIQKKVAEVTTDNGSIQGTILVDAHGLTIENSGDFDPSQSGLIS